MISDNKNHNHRLKISIVAHGIRVGGGISVAKNLIRSLTKQIPTAHYQIFIPKDLGYESCVDDGIDCCWITYKQRFSMAARWLYDKISIPRKIESFSPQIILCLGNIGVKKQIAPQILLVQDSHLFYPSRHYSRESLLRRIGYRIRRKHFADDLTRTSVLLCQTNTAATRISKLYNYIGETQLLPNAISVDSLAGTLTKGFLLPKRRENVFNIFYLTRYYPHKNIEIFIDLFIKYRSELKDVVLYLTIDKNQHPFAQKLLKSISDNRLSENIVNIGPIQQKDIAGYFKSMHAMVMPTTLESYSGSYLEAMAFECPILTSDLDFAHEVCGDAALYFDPWSVDSLYTALRGIIEEPELAKILISRGANILKRNSRSWEQNSEELASAILKLTAHKSA